MKLFITSIDTNIGKTIVSSIVCRALDYSYWKPVQSGDLHNSDSHKIQKLSPGTLIHPETYRLTQPLSPHESAKRDGISITLEKFKLPQNELLKVIAKQMNTSEKILYSAYLDDDNILLSEEYNMMFNKKK